MAKKRTPETSIILAKRYRGSQNSLGTTSVSSSQTSSTNSRDVHYHPLPEGYIQEHYSPKFTRKLVKASSVDTVNLKQPNTRGSTANAFFNFRAKSNSPQPPSKKVQFSDSPEPKKTTVVKKFLSKLSGARTVLGDNNSNRSAEDERPLLINRSNQFPVAGVAKEEAPIPHQINVQTRERELTDASSYIVNRLAKEAPRNVDENKAIRRERNNLVGDNKARPAAIGGSAVRREKKLKHSPPPEDPSITKRNIAEAAEKAIADHVNKNIGDKPNRASFAENINYGCCARFVTNMLANGLKLKERVVVAICIAVVLFTLVLVIDVQMDFGMSGHHLVPSHGKVRYVQNEDGPGSAYNSFRKRFLQKTHRYVPLIQGCSEV